MSRWLCQLSYGPTRPYGADWCSARAAVCQAASPRAVATGAQFSMKCLSLRLRVGCRSLRNALASICRMRSRVTAKS
jgi:hypothetical protein